MKNFLFIFAVLFFLFSGCATYQETQRIQDDLNRKTMILDEKINQKTTDITKSLGEIKNETAAIQNDMKKSDDSLMALHKQSSTVLEDTAALKEADKKLSNDIINLRKSRADRSADLTSLRDQIQQLIGANEKFQKDISTIMAKETRLSEDVKNLQGKLDESKNISTKYNELANKINSLEKSLGLKAKADTPPEEDKKSVTPEAAPTKDKDSAYSAAYETFKAGQYEKARAAFHDYIKTFPSSEYTDNAQFWIGESYYFEKKYEEAILEYEKVATDYPKSNKLPVAKLKQAFSFLELGDKSSAKIILEQIVRNYPNTNQARTAKSKLSEMSK
jgi:tol-pal system protein YbgF